ncbi:hypothetical protein STENM223S_04861 [Streptomyces tendae]
MHKKLRAKICLLAGALLCVAPQSWAAAPPARAHDEAAADPAYQVLVFSKTAGFRHSSIDDGIAALRELGTSNNFTVTATEDAQSFTAGNLAQYEAIVFLSTTGDVLNGTQQAAMEQYIEDGGGYVGVHAAADTEYDWPFYEGLAGALFHSHPAIQQATVQVEDRAHDATAHLGRTWQRTDEWYNYRTNPRTTAHVLASLDESSYSGGNMNGDHPIAWCKDYEGGRAFYTGGGHTDESYADPAFRRHLLGGIRWAAGTTRSRLPPGDRLPPPLRRHRHQRLETGGPRRLHPRRRHAHLARRARPVLVPGRGAHRRLLPEARLEGERGRQLGRLRRLPRLRRPVVGGGQRLRDPDRRHRHPRPHDGLRLRLPVGRHSPRATRHSIRRASGTRTRSGSPASGWNCSSTVARSTTSPTPTRHGASSRATSASRTTATATRRRSATSGSSSPAGLPRDSVRAPSRASTASASTSTARRPPTAPRSSSGPATTPAPRPGPPPAPAPAPAPGPSRRSANAWTSPAAPPPTAPRSNCGRATAPAHRPGARSPTAPCATRSPANASTHPAAPGTTAPPSTCGPATPDPTRNGPCPDGRSMPQHAVRAGTPPLRPHGVRGCSRHTFRSPVNRQGTRRERGAQERGSERVAGAGGE